MKTKVSPRITGESLFEPLPEDPIPLEPDFVPLDRSIIWEFNRLFWKHLKLWEKTYGEEYESALPAGVSESHRPEFVEKSTGRFLKLLERLKKENTLPREILVLEQGPGSGRYAKLFLDLLKPTPFYDQLSFILSDISQEVLDDLRKKLRGHVDHIRFIREDSPDSLDQFAGKLLLARHGNFWDQLPCKLLKISPNLASEIWFRATVPASFNMYVTRHDRYQQHTGFWLEELITTKPQVWKELWREVKLLTKTVLLPQNVPQKEILTDLVKDIQEPLELVWNHGVIENITDLSMLIDWKRKGYIEAVDVVISSLEGYKKDRRPKKYDGGLAVFVNGPLVKLFVEKLGLKFKLEQIRLLNSIVTIYK